MLMRIRIFLPFILTIVLIVYIGSQTSIWTALALFFAFIVLPSAYLNYVYNYGALMVMRGNLRGAIAHYTRLLSLPVNKIFVYTRRAALRNAVGDVEGAIADYTAAMQSSRQEIPALYGIRSA